MTQPCSSVTPSQSPDPSLTPLGCGVKCGSWHAADKSVEIMRHNHVGVEENLKGKFPAFVESVLQITEGLLRANRSFSQC